MTTTDADWTQFDGLLGMPLSELHGMTAGTLAAVGLAEVAFDTLAPILCRINRYSTVIYIVSGLLLIGVGGAMLANKIAWFASLGTGI